MQEQVWAVYERVAEAQAILHDHAHGHLSSTGVISRPSVLFAGEGLLRSLYEFAYFLVPPPLMPATPDVRSLHKELHMGAPIRRLGEPPSTRIELERTAISST